MKTQIKTQLVALLLGLLSLTNIHAAENAFLHLTINGNVISGRNDFTELAGEDLAEYIQLKSFEYELLRSDTRGRMEVSPVKVTKYLDSATPLIAQALARGETVEAVIKIFGNNPSDGSDLLVATYTLTNAKIVSDRVWLAPVTGQGNQLCEEVQFSYVEMSIQYTGVGIQTESLIRPQAPE